MINKISFHQWCNLSLLGFITATLEVFGLSGNPVFAQSNIVPDQTLGNESSIVVPLDSDGFPIDAIGGGATRRSNVFHSFKEFNVDEGRITYFLNNDNNLQNILTRVTGNNPSNILGTLGIFNLAGISSNPNLYLINPNGIVFGENARLDVAGSFLATTADGIQFGEQGFFSATNPEAPALLTVNPSALFFNQIGAGTIQNKSRAGLQVFNGESLVLLGGNIVFDGGLLGAFEGRIELGGLTEKGSVTLNIDDSNFNLSFPHGVAQANLELKNQAAIGAIGQGINNININANQININDGSGIIASSSSSETQTNRGIFIKASRLNINGNSSVIGTSTENNEKAGNINIEVSDSIEISGNSSGIGSFVSRFSTGIAGDVNIETDNLIMRGSRTGISTEIFGQGKGGNIRINSTTLLAENGAEVTSTTNGLGDAGDVNITASEIKLSGVSFPSAPEAQIFPSNLSTGTRGTGNAGKLTIETNNLTVEGGALISTLTNGQGEGADLTVNASGLVELIGTTADDRFSSGIGTETFGDKNAGNLEINADKLIVRDGAGVRTTTGRLVIQNGRITTTGGLGNGGNLIVNASEVQLIGTTKDGLSASGLFANTLGGAGDSGDITIETNKLIIRDGAVASASVADGSGRGGDLKVRASEIELTGKTPDGEASSALFTKTLGTGNAGILRIEAEKLNINNGAEIAASSDFDASGNAGDIFIQLKDSLEARDGTISTTSSNSSGGAIAITAKDIRLFGDSDIRTNVFNGEGEGGNITLTANTILALENSDIFSFARDGKGGDITFNTNGFFSTPLFTSSPQITDEATLDTLDQNNQVDVNASGSVNGAITGVPDITFIDENLTDLPDNQINTDNLIANSCIARSGKRQENSFIITGTGGLRNSPGDELISIYSTGEVRNVSDNNQSSGWKKGEPIIEPQGVYRLASGELVLSRECS